ncbi:DUF2388 domain-containing protein [Stutzerimonas nitrititolerans]|uniref:DUF2388 domain-containing protein n=1 Tax=Stutzerimonas nitrititolerans TaxID=2482751 RepID=UPI001BDBEF27|nr:DUF2388 domain-containing protein [Stutzerimonas nitrititolerans]MBT1122062.1 DUF2388 domain-containing protein [Stutzerimonas nitrititolerans]
MDDREMMRPGKKYLLVSLLLPVLLSANPAHAEGCIGGGCAFGSDNPFIVTAALSALTLYAAVSSFSIITDTSKENDRRYSQLARDDAAYFLASGGERRGAYFENALRAYRLESRTQTSPVSDLAFAQLVLASPTQD